MDEPMSTVELMAHCANILLRRELEKGEVVLTPEDIERYGASRLSGRPGISARVEGGNIVFFHVWPTDS